MFNLYQSGSITKELIETEQLGKCKLAFWFCILEDDVYKPISPPSLSSIIEESTFQLYFLSLASIFVFFFKHKSPLLRQIKPKHKLSLPVLHVDWLHTLSKELLAFI